MCEDKQLIRKKNLRVRKRCFPYQRFRVADYKACLGWESVAEIIIKSRLRKENISRDHTRDPVAVMENLRNAQLTESQNKNFSTFVNSMEYDPGDSDCIKSEYWSGSGSSSGVESIDNEDVFNDTKILTFPKKNKERKMSEISNKVMAQNLRKLGLVEIRERIQAISNQGEINHAQLQTLLSDRNFCLLLFHLFDDKGHGILDQPTWFGKLKYWTKVCKTY